MDPIKVLLVDDHPVVRSGIRNLLEAEDDIEVVGETGSGRGALKMAEELAPRVMLLDMELPDLPGVEVAREMAESHPGVRVLALSAYDDKEYIMELLASGAAGYLIKEEVPETIVDAVRGVARGEEGWMSRQVTAKMADWAQDGESGASELTDREREVLGLVVAGKTNQEIGMLLGISHKTVEKHLEGVFTKLGVVSRVEAAVYAVRHNLVKSSES